MSLKFASPQERQTDIWTVGLKTPNRDHPPKSGPVNAPNAEPKSMSRKWSGSLRTKNVDTTSPITHVSLCAGYGGIDLGLKRAIPNLRLVAACEIEAFACANLVSKMEAGLLDAAPLWTDLKTFPWGEFRDRVSILSGGYPCQPFSAAGKRLGKEDPRHLWPWIADGIRAMRPQVCFFENVEGHISLGLREVVGELESLGYETTWGIFSASEVGAPHQRKRVFILAYRCGDGCDGRAVQDRIRGWIVPKLPQPLQGGCTEVRSEIAGCSNDARELAHFVNEGSQGGILGRENPQREALNGHSGCSGSSAYGRWPSRPGQPQFSWEPPRVVADARCRQHGGREISERSIRTAQGELGEAMPMGNSAQREDHGREPGDMGIEAGQGRCGDHAADGAGEVLGNTNSPRPQERQGQRGAGIQGTHADGGEDAERQTQPSLGGNPDGAPRGVGHAELYVSCDNRTDELRLLGNGVVPATAERALRVLLDNNPASFLNGSVSRGSIITP